MVQQNFSQFSKDKLLPQLGIYNHKDRESFRNHKCNPVSVLKYATKTYHFTYAL